MKVGGADGDKLRSWTPVDVQNVTSRPAVKNGSICREEFASVVSSSLTPRSTHWQNSAYSAAYHSPTFLNNRTDQTTFMDIAAMMTRIPNAQYFWHAG